MAKKTIFLTIGVVILLIIGGIIASVFLRRDTNITQNQESTVTVAEERDTADVPRLAVIAEDLEVPWDLTFLPDGSLLVTERPGRVRRITKDGTLLNEPLLTLDVVQKIQGEGGLHGITLHPEFEKNNYVYVYYTYETQGEETLNRVSRYTLRENKLTDEQIILDEIPGALFHDGGRIAFGPDDFLYITTGDAREPSLAQDRNSLAGKILRVTDAGEPAPGNPFGNEVFTLGHRNPQGLTWDDEGRLWATEHGQNAKDELNLIERGKNYGWPIIEGTETQQGLVTPILQSGSTTWAPSGAAALDGAVYFVGLRGQALYKATPKGNTAEFEVFLKNELGRLRAITVGPDNMLYITTSNRDGRGIPNPGDDKILRINPEKL